MFAEPDKIGINWRREDDFRVKNLPTDVGKGTSAATIFPHSPLKADHKVALERQINRLANCLARQLEIEFGEIHRY